jgi:glycosyltransferase involved in cell wall biosynthesis
MHRLCVVDPVWTRYRLPVFEELSRYSKVDWVFSPSRSYGAVSRSEAPDLRYIEVKMLRSFGGNNGMYQTGLMKYLLTEKPDAIKMFANPRYLSFWTTVFAARLLGIPFHAHGVAFFKRKRIGFGRRIIMRLILRLVTSYIAYAPIVRESLAAQGFEVDKVVVVPNSLLNPFPVRPEEKTGAETGILFVGRLRRGSGLSMLVRVMGRLKEEGGFPFRLHVVGDGEEAEELRRTAGSVSWVSWHGAASDAELREVSRKCLFGCYPGSAGLSVVHMMSLSLPVIVHNDLSSHEGPEPSYVKDGVNGLLYERESPGQSLYQLLQRVAINPDHIASMQRSAFQEYLRLTQPSYAERLWSIFTEDGVRMEKNLSASMPL